MNLELIRKYEKEFLHMLHGGKLKYFTGKEWLTYSGVELWTASNDLKIIIDDQYVEFRKASADGKTIEELYYTPTDHWGKHLSGFAISPKMLRIKPEEPKFKVGDYIIEIYGNQLHKVLELFPNNLRVYEYSTNASYTADYSDFKLWEPREGEICIFWSDGTYSAVIGIFSHMNQEKYVTNTTQKWSNCMPFTGILPPHMKDN